MNPWWAVELLETLEAPRKPQKKLLRAMTQAFALSEYILVYEYTVGDKLEFSTSLMGSEFIGRQRRT